MKNLYFSLTFLCAGLFLLQSCHKDVHVEPANSFPMYFNTEHQENCIDDETGDAFAVSSSANYSAGPIGSVSVSYYNTASHMVYVFSSTANIECVRLDNSSGTIVHNGVNTITPGNTLTLTFPLPSGWEAGDDVDRTFWVNRNNCSGDGGGQRVIIATSYELVGLCDRACDTRGETAYAGDLPGGNTMSSVGPGCNNSWWFVFDIDGDTKQTIWAGQDINIGSADYDAGAQSITLSFSGGWGLAADEDDSVKWYSYADGELHDCGRPAPGLAPNHGNSPVISTANGDRYFAIHIDAEICE